VIAEAGKREKIMSCDSSKHMCVLKEQGLDDCIETLSDKPVVECRHCGARANSIRNICAAHFGERAPAGAGGQGLIGPAGAGTPPASAEKPA
jgi:hypothetical protein